ncbi:MAG: DUF262 domain-containing protein [Bacteroidetes bacterium]|nr:DUF262 domain-containing protein [Bacteroidota bacterium]
MNAVNVVAETDATFGQEDLEQPIPPADIVAYNELRSCADLFRMHATGKLEIQPDFQREVVWKQDDQTRFIDSLVKQLPIPSMCFSLDYKTQKWKVIDGLQRMTSIIRFLSTAEWKLSDLSDIHPNLRGAKNSVLRLGSDEQKRLFALVEDVSIPVTVIRCDYTQPSHMLYLFTIFHRLNSGGVRLTNQEIRNCIYTGPFNDLLKEFDKKNPDWKELKKRIWGSMDRFRSVEVLLRVLAFVEDRQKYDGNLARFLNDYMYRRANDSSITLEAIECRLKAMTKLARNVLSTEPKKKLPLLLVEALLVAMYDQGDALAKMSQEAVASAFASMRAHPSFVENARYAITSSDNVRIRLDAAVAAFSI